VSQKSDNTKRLALISANLHRLAHTWTSLDVFGLLSPNFVQIHSIN